MRLIEGALRAVLCKVGLPPSFLIFLVFLAPCPSFIAAVHLASTHEFIQIGEALVYECFALRRCLH